jgi:hypothetical protein
LAKARIAPTTIPGRLSGRVTVRKTQTGDAPSVPGGLFQLAVGGVERQADRADHQREGHDGRGERGAGPAEGDRHAKLGQEPPDGGLRAERDQQQEARNHRGQDERQVDKAVQERLSREGPSATGRRPRGCRRAG